MAAPSKTVQILMAIVLLVIVYVATLWFLGRSEIVSSLANQRRVKPKETSNVIKGYAPLSLLANMRFNTVNIYDPTFVKMARSVNTKGGAQFSYSFWIKLERSDDALYKDLVILLKGDTRKFKSAYYNTETNKMIQPAAYGASSNSGSQGDYLVTCPMISFGNSYRQLKVRLNTTTDPKTDIDISMDDSNNLARRNILSLLPLAWYLFTFTFEDNVQSDNGHENGIRVRFWVNDVLVQESSASNDPRLRSALRQNDGDLCLFPDPPALSSSSMADSSGSGSFVKIGDIKYCNFALSDSEIQSLFAAGPPRQPMKMLDSDKDKPAYLSAFNKIDVYNH